MTAKQTPLRGKGAYSICDWVAADPTGDSVPPHDMDRGRVYEQRPWKEVTQ